MTVIKVVFLGTVAFGALKASSLIWTMADVGVGTMAWLNLIAILLLQKPAFAALKDYEAQRNLGIKSGLPSGQARHRQRRLLGGRTRRREPRRRRRRRRRQPGGLEERRFPQGESFSELTLRNVVGRTEKSSFVRLGEHCPLSFPIRPNPPGSGGFVFL